MRSPQTILIHAKSLMTAAICQRAKPPQTGVPIPGANAGSNATISKDKYVGTLPTICFTFSMT